MESKFHQKAEALSTILAELAKQSEAAEGQIQYVAEYYDDLVRVIGEFLAELGKCKLVD